MTRAESTSELARKKRFFEAFFAGEGPFPLIFARPHLAGEGNYRKHNLIEQHADVEKLFEDNQLGVARTRSRTDDGIPTIRADLGVTLIPSAFGLPLFIGENSHPSLREHLDRDRLRTVMESWSADRVVAGEIPLAFRFYELLRESGEDAVPYVPDTQGVFDLAHLLLGNDVFLLPFDDPEFTERVLDFCLDVFVHVTRRFKRLLGEADSSMVHGHGMTRGVWFPHCGARISEDSTTLLSMEMVESLCVPRIRTAIEPFGRGFMHYCGHRPDIFELYCRMPEIAVINLGNPELYDLDDVFGICGRTGTVLFQHFVMAHGESHNDYLERLGSLARRHGARLILIAPDCPDDPDEQRRIVGRWHQLTG